MVMIIIIIIILINNYDNNKSFKINKVMSAAKLNLRIQNVSATSQSDSTLNKWDFFPYKIDGLLQARNTHAEIPRTAVTDYFNCLNQLFLLEHIIGMSGRTQEKLVDHEPETNDLQVFEFL